MPGIKRGKMQSIGKKIKGAAKPRKLSQQDGKEAS